MDIIKSIFNIYLQNPSLFFSTVILLASCILLKKYYPEFRGYMGEFWVKLELKKLPKDKYIILNNIMLKNIFGTHQIDHIVLSNYGLFVIEMKNYYGLIKGREHDNKWCQYLGKKKSYFINPIHQNYGHVKSLCELLKIDVSQFTPIVCFSNQAKIDINSKNIVIQIDFLKQEILKFNELKNNFDLKELQNIILSNNIIDKNKRKEHIINIKKNIEANIILEERMICPRCGENLINKAGKYGNFIGCSNYPKCNYIKK